MKCQNCTKETSNLKFCSRSCSASKTNKENPRRKPIYRICSYCKESKRFKASRRFCSQECKNNSYYHANTQLKDLIYKKHHKASAFALIRARARYTYFSRKNSKKICEKCGYDKHIEIAHLKPIASYDLTSTIAEVNHIDNLIGLCPNCHWELDHS